jgi:predicted transcriptional regulator
MSQVSRHLLALSAQIVAAHARNNQLEAGALLGMIRNVFNTLSALDPSTSAPEQDFTVPSRDGHVDHTHDHNGHALSHAHNRCVHPSYGQTVFGDHLVCMEDGLSMKMLKRHLLTVHGMTPGEYRRKWGLAENYPMVAPEYAKLRSGLALQSGLGLKPEDRPAKGRKTRRN